MDEHFWHQKWERNDIGFHEHEANPLLIRYFPALALPAGSRVFVPLCGKTLDIHWLLARGYRVVGVEWSRLAVEQLFSELGIQPNITAIGPVSRYSADHIDVLVGDIFHVSSGVLGPVDAVYDRAALVALPEPMRDRYAAHLLELTDGAPQLLIVYNYDPRLLDGPPFSIRPEEVSRHYQERYELKELASVEIKGGLKGKYPATEQVWRLTKKKRGEEPPEETPGDPEAKAPSRRGVLASLSLSMLMPSLATSIANAGLPTLAQAFRASFQEAQWILLAYLLAITAFIVGVGRLGDIMGRRRLLQVGIGLFTVASLLCGLAPVLWLLMVARVVQGIGAAIMMALAVALVGEAVPKTKTGSAMGLLGTMSAVGTTLGPSLGGLLVAGLGWQSLFFVHVPLGILNVLLVARCLPAKRSERKAEWAEFDWSGTLLLALTLAAYALAVTIGRGRFGVTHVVLLLAVVVGVGLFRLVEMRASSPLLRWEMFHHPLLRGSLTRSALASTVLMTTLVVGPFYLSRAFGLPMAVVGFVLSVGPLMAALVGVPAGRLVDRLGAQRMTWVGLAGIAVGSLLLSTIPAQFGVVGYLVPLVVITSGYAIFQVANNTALLTEFDPEQRGVLSGMLGLSRNLGLITGASVMGAVFALASGGNDPTTVPPEAVARGMRITFAVAALLVIGALVVSSRRAKVRRGATLYPMSALQ